jgi:hypothetical protein
MDTESGQQYQLRIFGQNVEAAVNEAIELRKRLRATTIRDIRDVEAMARLDREARRKLESVELIADAMIGEALRCGGNARALDSALDMLATMAGDFLGGNEKMGEQIARHARTALAIDLPTGKPTRKPFHWALEFPEVFEQGGFDGIVGNPPFLGNRLWKKALGEKLQWQCQMVLGASPGKIDLCVVFHRRAADLLRTGGCYGMLATSNIAEGSAIENGLGVIVQNGASTLPERECRGRGRRRLSLPLLVSSRASGWPIAMPTGKTVHVSDRGEPEAADVWVPQALPDAPFAFAGVTTARDWPSSSRQKARGSTSSRASRIAC